MYGRETHAQDALIAGVRAVFAAENVPADGFAAGVDLGARQFLTGLGRALQIRVLIQRAIGVLMASDGGDAERAYRTLWKRAAEAGMSLSAAARSIVG